MCLKQEKPEMDEKKFGSKGRILIVIYPLKLIEVIKVNMDLSLLHTIVRLAEL